MRNLMFIFAIALLTMSLPGKVMGQSTYQGQLHDGGVPYNGLVDLTFQLYDAPTGGATVGVLQEVDNVAVDDGLFQAEFFLPNTDYQDGLWLEVTVNGTTLGPRQRVTAAPWAKRADHAVSADRAVRFNIGLANASGSGSLAMGGFTSASGTGSFAGGAAATASHDYSFVWSGLGSGTFATTDDSQFLVRAAGGVGINTNSPAAALDIMATDTRGFRLQRTGYTVAMAQDGDGGISLYAGKSSSGGVAIGGTCQSGSGSCRALAGASLSSTGYGLYVTGVSGSRNYIQRSLSLGERLFYETSPVAQAGSTACWVDAGSAGYRLNQCSSSGAFKDDVGDIDVGLDLVSRLRPVRFTWKENGQADVGLIAEEVAAIEPRLVSYEDDRPVGVNYRHLTAVLIKAIQQDHAQTQMALAVLNDELEQRDVEIAALRAELSEVRALAASTADTADRLAALEAILLEGAKVAARD